MRPCTLRPVVFFLLALAAILATGLLAPDACRAQTNQPDQSSTQSQPGAADKSSQKDDLTSDTTTTRLRIRITNPEDKPVGNASVYVRFNEPGSFLHKDKLAVLVVGNTPDFDTARSKSPRCRAAKY